MLSAESFLNLFSKSFFNQGSLVRFPRSTCQSDETLNRGPRLRITFLCILFVLQAEASMIGYLYDEVTRLLRKFLGKFVTTKTIKPASDITTVPFRASEHQHPDSNMAIGMDARGYLINNPDIPEETTRKFFE